MDNTQLLNNTASELAIRLANTEVERANFKAQAEALTTENNQLKEQIEELKKDDEKDQAK